MSFRWDVRVDTYQRGVEKIKITLRRMIGLGYTVKVDVDYPVIFHGFRSFSSKESSEMYISRLKNKLCIPVDGLLERVYYYVHEKE